MRTDASYTTDWRGLSTDDKPTNAGNGDTFYEIDTGDLYIYDGTGKTWVAQGE